MTASRRRAGMVLSENWTQTPPHDLRALVELARVAEGCGVDTVMLSEHVVLAGDSSAAGLVANPRDYAAPGNQDPATPGPTRWCWRRPSPPSPRRCGSRWPQ